MEKTPSPQQIVTLKRARARAEMELVMSVHPEFWHLGSYEYPFYRSKMQNLFRSYIRKSFLILDAGCGPYGGGYITTMPASVQGIGLDISLTNIKKSVRISEEIGQNNSSFLVGSIEKMPFREDVFDIIICQDVLEHVEYKENAISEMTFSLRRGGRILITTTNSANPAIFIDDMLPKRVSETLIYILGGAHHYERHHRLNKWNLNRILIKNGLRLKKVLMIGHPPFGKLWIYQYSETKPPKIFYAWIVFNKLTNICFLKNFKEIMIVLAEKWLFIDHKDNPPRVHP